MVQESYTVNGPLYSRPFAAGSLPSVVYRIVAPSASHDIATVCEMLSNTVSSAGAIVGVSTVYQLRVKVAETVSLSNQSSLNDLAFTVADSEMSNGPAYKVLVSVGSDPSSV